MREVIFDTETTGLDPSDGHRICEIGCVELVNRIQTGRTFHAYLNPLRPMPAEAEAVHGLGDAFLANKPTFGSIVRQLLEFLGDARLVAHNAEFDRRFLNWELRNCGETEIGAERVEDTLAIARRKFPGAKHSLDALCQRFGIDLAGRDKHGALLDARLLADVYVELTGGRQIGLQLGAAVAASTTLEAQIERRFWPPRAHAPSAEELEKHRIFVTGLTTPLWLQLSVGDMDTGPPA
jgi:DNA polymerase-3 subunit epsilon